ncbi:LacI family DNA-binding transcriptional regulator [Jonesia quinghaiensis]|uniref:LacI family DNA-binding transcriptional regulator n=1 Tax=Jonesia quinghaiensis TaxID=262806 RepID=UPI0012F8BCD5|nr:LacI family DNA-binding transcriptional regulator [Jonesia quinghaiensis]
MTEEFVRHQVGGRVTATMVARHAGVSVATVSLVVNGKHRGRVSPANVAKVRQSIAELGYVVDRVASSLSKGSSDLVILISPDISNPFFAGVIAGIKQVLGKRYQLLVSVTDDGNLPQAQEVRASLEFRPAALLVFAPAETFVDAVRGHAPMVLIDAPGMEHLAPTINIDIEASARALGEHLTSLGHRTFGYLDSRTGSRTFQMRRDALMDQISGSGGHESISEVATSIVSYEAAGEAFTQAWPQWSRDGVTSVICATDIQAYGVIGAARSLGLAIPGDLSVASFDNLSYSAISSPSLTSVELPSVELGRSAASVALALIDGEAVSVSHEVFAGQLHVRESTAALTTS